jgi:hypothetical protein
VRDAQVRRPTEVITAKDTGVRACLYTDESGTYSFELERKVLAHWSDPEMAEVWAKWVAVPLEKLRIAQTYQAGITDWAEALTRVSLALAGLIEYSTSDIKNLEEG